ncbi:uncharacterized protein [Typha angustifolia]|uniref:uncharacterized protein n=1 Tax=Typha angustifolia TaxID=59011 RepID=UPI003C2E6977
MWATRKLSGRPLLGSSIYRIAANNSWEEQAFAKDAAGGLGGCVWPPRSYPCTFCRREFRSAQALGGHMNVHRRDRARLKQPLSFTIENDQENHQQQQTTCASNPNFGDLAASLSPIVSAASKLEDGSSRTLFSPSSCSSSIIKENPVESLLPTTQTITRLAYAKKVVIADFNLRRKNLKQREGCYRMSGDLYDADEEAISRKRRRRDETFPFFLSFSSGDQQLLQPELLKTSTSPVEELDLELRLGLSKVN